MAERDIRKLLKARVESYGGHIRAVAWIGRAHAPDVLCLFPSEERHVFVETKFSEGAPREGQLREHERLRAAGCEVVVICSMAELDEWLPLP